MGKDWRIGCGKAVRDVEVVSGSSVFNITPCNTAAGGWACLAATERIRIQLSCTTKSVRWEVEAGGVRFRI
jgi:hypothetical protein